MKTFLLLKQKMFALFLLALCIGQIFAGTPWVPEPRDAGWIRRHQELTAQTAAHRGDEQIVFIGDSITDWWQNAGKNVWAKYYAPRHAYDYGIAADKTEHVLWRLENKEFDGLKPKVTVVMIGISI